MDGAVIPEEIFNLDRINIFPSADYDIFFPIHQENEPLPVFLGHISCVKPSIRRQDFGGSFFIVIIAGHYARPFDCQFSDSTFRYCIFLFIYDFYLPAIAGFTDSAHFMNVFHTQMNTARADGFA